MEYYFVVLSDPHIGWKSASDSPSILSNWTKCVSRVRALRPAPKFVVCLGDMVHGVHRGRDSKEVASDVASFKSVLAGLKGVPIFFTPGNHCVEDCPTPDTLGWYERHFGTAYQLLRYPLRTGSVVAELPSTVLSGSDDPSPEASREPEPEDLFILLDSNSLRFPQDVPKHVKHQRAFFKTAMKTRAPLSRHVCVLMHHAVQLGSLRSSSLDDVVTDHYGPKFLIGEEGHRLILSAAAHAPNFRWIFSGHLHHNDWSKSQGTSASASASVHHVTIGSCTRALRQWFRDDTPEGFLVVKVEAGGMLYRYFELHGKEEGVDLDAVQFQTRRREGS